jgi:hypothetical protein
MLKINLFLPQILCEDKHICGKELYKEVIKMEAGIVQKDVRYSHFHDKEIVEGDDDGITIANLDFSECQHGNSQPGLLNLKKNIKESVNTLSAELGLPIARARITGINFGYDFIMQNPVQNYFSFLESLDNANRLISPEKLQYEIGKAKELAFYEPSKSEKQKERPEISRKAPVLRYEIQYKGGSSYSKQPMNILVEDLYDGSVLDSLLCEWYSCYCRIKKNDHKVLNFKKVKTTQDLYQAGKSCFLFANGGTDKTMELFDKCFRNDSQTPKQRFDLKKEINKACSSPENYLIDNDLVRELDSLVKAVYEKEKQVSAGSSPDSLPACSSQSGNNCSLWSFNP